MTADQVINIVLVYGVPNFPIYGAQPVVSGQQSTKVQADGVSKVLLLNKVTSLVKAEYAKQEQHTMQQHGHMLITK